MNKLEKLAFKYGTHKCPQVAHSYTHFYDYLFANKRKSIRKLMEIGVGSKKDSNWPNYVNGASLYMWQDFFPKANIYGIDINKKLVFKKGRIQTFLCNQADRVKLTKLIKTIGSDIDIVIDDGSHQPEDIVASCKTLMPLLKKDVIYIIEETNRTQAAMVIEKLKNYNCQIMRRSRMRSSDDRLIRITSKNG
jgi:hypothetical protein